jgi:hypothetical protein
MPSTSGTRRLAAALGAAALTLGSAPATVAQTPVLVSPGAESAAAVTEARCPTFSWGGVPDAPGYELAVFRLTDDPAEEPALVMRVTLPPDSRSFTPSVGQCLTRGQRYAWSVAARPGEGERAELGWAPAYVFEVETAGMALAGAAPTSDRVPQGATPRAPDGAEPEPGRSADDRRRRATLPLALGDGPLLAPTSGITRISSAVSTPVFGAASLSVSQQIHLAEGSDLFKGGDLFLWDEPIGRNTALGREALSSVSGTANANTAVGFGALRSTTGGAGNTAVGILALQANTTGLNNTAAGKFAMSRNTTGYSNTATGTSALANNTTGRENTAVGKYSLLNNTSGIQNSALGTSALFWNYVGSDNVAVGFKALYSTTGNSNVALGRQALVNLSTGSSNIAVGPFAGAYVEAGSANIHIGNLGSSSDSGVIRIGQFQTQTHIAGIAGKSVLVASGVPVLIDGNNKLGTLLSSRRLKQDIHDLGPLADRLLELRPVSFRYREHVASNPDSPVQFGLIAEEVAEVFPELVVYDEDGKPQTVKYHLLSSLLLGELQRMHRRLEELESRAGVTAPDPGKRRRRSSGRTASERRNDRTLEGARE